MPETNGRYISFKAVIGTLITILIMTVGFVVNNTWSGIIDARQKIECLQKEKLDVAQYRLDLGEIKGALQRIDNKLDRMGRGR